MADKRIATVLISGLFLMASFVMVACQTAAKADYSQTAAADTARWVAMGQAYAPRTAAADNARWVAMGQAYSRAGIGNSAVVQVEESQDITADAARWVAMGQAYARAGLDGLIVAKRSQE